MWHGRIQFAHATLMFALYVSLLQLPTQDRTESKNWYEAGEDR